MNAQGKPGRFTIPGGLLSFGPWKCASLWWVEARAIKQRSLLRLLNVAATDRLAAAPLVEARSTEERGRFRRRLRRLARRLTAGTGLADALEQTPGVLTDEQALAIRFGEQSGTLPTVLDSALGHSRRAELSVAARLRQIAFYVAIVAISFLVIMTFFMVKIIPAFQAIFNDFDLDLPRITVYLIVLSNWFVDYWYWLVLLVLVVGWLFRSQTSRRFFSRHVSARILRPLAQLRIANVLSLLAISSRAGRPLAGAISTLARYHFDPKLRHKLLFVRNEIEQGANMWQSMARAKLLTPAEAHALDKASTSETRAWAMERLADMKRYRVEQRIDFYVSLLQPAATLLVAAVVLFVAVASLLPIFSLPQSLAG